MDGCVFNIQRFSIHDGPGIRTTVFLKGCNLSCFWCHNPEGQSFTPVLQIYKNLCIGCGECVSVCENACAGPCKNCGECARVCPTGARVLAGKNMTPRETADIILRDRDFYASDDLRKRGGATFSGGEPLMSSAFVAKTEELLAVNGVSCAIETAGCVPWRRFSDVSKNTELYLFDIKHHDAGKFREYAGGDLSVVFSNLKKLAEGSARLWIRIPLIPSVNDSREDMEKIASAIKCAVGTARAERVEVMPFHRLGEGKYISLDRKYAAEDLLPPDAETIERFKSILAEAGFPAC